MLLDGVPSFSEITVVEAHRGGGREDLKATEKWHLALLPEAIQQSTPKDTRRNGPGQQQA